VGVASPRLDAEVLLAAAIHGRRIDVFADSQRVLSVDEWERYRDFIDRRAGREPLAYILGKREFWSLEFQVTPRVLIPRPETERLIEVLLARVGEQIRNAPLRILDVGAGSGVLAVVAARELPASRITAVDLCPEALAVARANAVTHAVAARIDFFQSDLFTGLPPSQGFDFILSNPPYIPSARLAELMPEVACYEPRAALDGGADGLDFYRNIISGALDRLAPGGGLILEAGDDQGPTVADMLRAQGGYETPELIRDYGGMERVVFARRRRDG
jgi:release factor glutamine methyltransferase